MAAARKPGGPPAPASLKAIRTWHRRIALALGLFLAFQGLTGAVSQYRFWLLGQLQAGYSARAVQPAATPGEVLKILANDLPDFAPAHVMYPAASAPDTAVMAMGTFDPATPMSRMITLDQYGGQVISDMPIAGAAGWIGLANSLHRWTVLGTSGRIFLTLLGLCTIAVAALGLGLYWRTRKARPRGALARLHRSCGIVAGAILLCIATTGTALNLYTWAESSNGTLVTSYNMRSAMVRDEPVAINVDLDTAYGTALGEVAKGSNLAAFAPAGAHARYHWFAFNSPRMRRVDILIDPLDGSVAGVKPAGLMERSSGLRSWLFPVHSGYILGPLGGFLFALTGLSLIGFFVSGVVIWQSGRRVRRGKARA